MLAPMDRFYLAVICGRILLPVTAPALTVPVDLHNSRANGVVVLDGAQR